MLAPEDKTRCRLLEAAGQVFAEKGFVAASVGEITERAEANRAAINYHFRSKEQLYVEAVRYAADSCSRRAPMPAWAEGVPAEVRLKDFIRAFLSRFLSPGAVEWHGRLITRELAQPTAGACAQFVEEFVRPTFAVLQGILNDLVPADLSAMRQHMLGASIIGQCLHYLFARNVLQLLVGPDEYAQYDLDRVTEHVYAFSSAALRGLFPARKEGGRP